MPAVALFGQQLHAGLEAIDVEAQCSIQFFELVVGSFSHQAVIAHHLAHHRSILLFDETLVIFHARASSREGEVFLLTIGHHCLIEEFRAIIGMHAEHGKREQALGMLDGSQNALRALREQGETFGPPGCHIGERQRPDKASRKTSSSVCATMGHQIGLHKAWLGFMLLLDGANGDLLFEQGSASCGREAMQPLCS
jgi:hypothetical protein